MIVTHPGPSLPFSPIIQLLNYEVNKWNVCTNILPYCEHRIKRNNLSLIPMYFSAVPYYNTKTRIMTVLPLKHEDLIDEEFEPDIQKVRK